MKLYLQAIRALPETFVDERTRLMNVEGMVVAINPEFAPIAYTKAAPEWKKFEFEEAKRVEPERETPEQRAEAEEAFNRRYADDKADEMTKEQWGAWVDALPRSEFMAMMRIGCEVKQ